ncbi:MAG: helix-turn-helix transcriptional regulator [Verrucomicrobiota bacterium]
MAIIDLPAPMHKYIAMKMLYIRNVLIRKSLDFLEKCDNLVTMNDRKKQFGGLLLQARQAKKMTQRQLRDASTVSNELICMLENGKKNCGQTVAVKLANGLGLLGNERVKFLETANESAQRNHQQISPALVDALLDELKMAGIDSRQVKTVSREFKHNLTRHDVAVEMQDGKRYGIEIKRYELK